MAATAIIGAASAASADEIAGTIGNIDLTTHTFTVGGTVFTAAPSNTVGPKLESFKEGDRVRVYYEANASDSLPWNAMILNKSQ